MKFSAVVFSLLVSMTASGFALEKKPLLEVSTDDMTNETQVIADSGDDHLTLYWWLPYEFWAASVGVPADPGTKELLETLKDFTFLGVVQADISDSGIFDFYDEETVRKNARLIRMSGDGKKTVLTPSTADNENVQLLIDAMRPILSGALGNMGQSLVFIVFDDKDANGARQIDPYGDGGIILESKTSKGTLLESSIPFPLNCLYVPRKCPNGQDAHVSWKFCPWTGEALPE